MPSDVALNATSGSTTTGDRLDVVYEQNTTLDHDDEAEAMISCVPRLTSNKSTIRYRDLLENLTQPRP